MNPSIPALSLSFVAGLLAGCSSGAATPPNAAVPAPLVVQRALAAATAHAVAGVRQAKSRMAPGAKRKALLYASDGPRNEVFIYTYPKAKSVGALTGLASPSGMCTDKKGDIWIANFSKAELLEYAHDGTSPIATLSDPEEYPYDCSVDPTTGDLAVANIFGPSEGQGSLAIYKNASGSPKIYYDSNIYYLIYCGYDPKGNLFVDGLAEGTGSGQLGDLPAGGSTIGSISVSGITSFGAIQWDGKYLAVGDGDYKDESTSAVDRLTISGSSATIVGTTVLDGSKDVQQFTIPLSPKAKAGEEGKIVVGPNLASLSNVMLWKYPKGGSAIKTIGGYDNPLGTAVSFPK